MFPFARWHGFASTHKPFWRFRIMLSPRTIEFRSLTRRRKSGSFGFARWRSPTKAGTCVKSTRIRWSHKWATWMLSVRLLRLRQFRHFCSQLSFYSFAWHLRRPNQPRCNCSGVRKRDTFMFCDGFAWWASSMIYCATFDLKCSFRADDFLEARRSIEAAQHRQQRLWVLIKFNEVLC